MNVPAPDPQQPDIYSVGFDKALNRAPSNEISSPSVPDTLDNAVEPQIISAGSYVAGAANTILVIDPTKGIWLGNAKYESAPFKVSMAGELKASSATVSGAISASSIDIPDTTTANSFHVASNGDTWWGATALGAALAKVLATGAATFTNVTVTGGSIVTSVLSGLVGLANTNIAAQGWNQTCAFSVTDSDTIAWGAGTFTTASGTAYSIGASNTGNMAAKTYIYLDIAVSTTAYQTTTTAATAVGAGKALVAVAQNNTTEATYFLLNSNSQNIDASNIVTGSITANEIAASTITAGKLSVSQLSSITADMGTLTAGVINLSTAGGNIHSGQSAYNTGAGFWLEYNSGTPRFSIGDPTGRYLTWDGSSLTINGYVQNSKGAFGGDGSDGALTISSGTTTISAASARVVTKNYTSVSITGTGALAFSTPHANGTVIFIKSQGATTLTSSAAPMVDVSSMGSSGGSGSNPTGTNGTTGYGYDYTTNEGGAGSSTTPGAGGAAFSGVINYQTYNISLEKWRKILMGAGGGGGGGNGGGGSPGNGGNGGGVLIIECAGAWNFTTASGISVNGATGGNGSGGSANAGGGGGGGGYCIVLYNTLTANSGTITSSGGTGGNNDSGNVTNRAGGGGGAGYTNAGIIGTASTVANAKTGGNGGSGSSTVLANTAYA